MTRTITKTTTQRKIDAYRTTAPQQIDGQWVVIEKAGCTQNDHGSYDWTLVVRDCTDDERKQGRIDQISHTLSLPLDNDEERRTLENERLALEGKPPLPTWAEQQKATRASQAAQQAVTQPTIDAARSQMQLAHGQRDWTIISAGMRAATGKASGYDVADIQSTRWDDDEISEILS